MAMIKRPIDSLNPKKQKKNHNMKKILTLAIATILLAFTSCSPFRIRTDYSEKVDFTLYKTYQFRIDDLKLNDLDKDRVLNEVAKNIQSKGLSASSNPDVIINLKASHKKIQDVNIDPGFGMWGWGRPWGMGMGIGRSWTHEYHQGSLEIDIIDAKTNRLVWQGIGSGISVDAAKAKQKQIPEIVAEILTAYPPIKK